MRYFVQPRKPASYWPADEAPMLEAREVYESAPADTGLLDENGHPIYRRSDPIGFVRWK